MSDPYEAGPPEYQPDEEPGDDDRALWADAAADQDDQEREGVYYPWLDKPWVIAQNRSIDRGDDDG